jgi:DNA-binding transcriptional LysR family regulator
VGPRFKEIEAGIAALSELRQKPAGTIRITATDYAAEAVLWPKLAKFLREYPDIKVEILIEQGLTDIVAHRYDAGVRLGEQIAKDMIAVRIGPDMRMAVVGASSYFAKRPPPKTPQELIAHKCINLRLPTHGGSVRLGIRKRQAPTEGARRRPARLQRDVADVEGSAGRFGLAYVPEDLAQPHLATGRLKRALEDWCPPFAGPSLLPEPPGNAGLHLAGRGAALPALLSRSIR